MGSGEERGRVRARERRWNRERESMVWFPVRQSPTADMEGIAGNQAMKRGLKKVIHFSHFVTLFDPVWPLKRQFCECSFVFGSLFKVIYCILKLAGNCFGLQGNLMIMQKTDVRGFLWKSAATSRCQAGQTHSMQNYESLPNINRLPIDGIKATAMGKNIISLLSS